MKNSTTNYVIRSIKSNDFCMLELKFLAYDSNHDSQSSILFKRHSDQHITFENIQLKTNSNKRRWRGRYEWIIISSNWNVFILNLQRISSLLNSYSLWHRHQTTHARISTYLNREKNLYEEEKSLAHNSIAAKIVVDKLSLIRRSDVYALFLLLLLISNTKNRLRDKSNKRVHALLETFFN